MHLFYSGMGWLSVSSIQYSVASFQCSCSPTQISVDDSGTWINHDFYNFNHQNPY